MCALLLDLGGDATQRDSEGLSPLDYARRKKLDYVVALLTCHGTAVADFARASRSEVIYNVILNHDIVYTCYNKVLLRHLIYHIHNSNTVQCTPNTHKIIAPFNFITNSHDYVIIQKSN